MQAHDMQPVLLNHELYSQQLVISLPHKEERVIHDRLLRSRLVINHMDLGPVPECPEFNLQGDVRYR
jgi:hypothetical protein